MDGKRSFGCQQQQHLHPERNRKQHGCSHLQGNGSGQRRAERRNGSIAITANGKTITDGYVSSGSDVTFTVTPENTDDMVQAWQVNGSTVAEMTDTADAPLSYTVQNVTADTKVPQR